MPKIQSLKQCYILYEASEKQHWKFKQEKVIDSLHLFLLYFFLYFFVPISKGIV